MSQALSCVSVNILWQRLQILISIGNSFERSEQKMFMKCRKLFLSVIICVAAAGIEFVGATEMNFRLPNATRPESYDLTVRTRVDEEDFSFNGDIKINIVAIESTTSITLHQKQTTVDEIQFESNGNSIPVDRYSYNRKLQFLTVSVVEPLIVGNNYTLRIKYHGILREDYLGFYRTSYLNDNENRIWLATTQFQDAEARHAFPCYDEPGIKVPFTLRMIHGRSYAAISNMPVRSVTDK